MRYLPMRSPIGPDTGDTTAPTSAAVPVTSAMALASPAPDPKMSSTSSGRKGRYIWLARIATPKITNRRRMAGSRRTPRSAPRASSMTRPAGTTSGRISRVPMRSTTTIKADSAAETQKTSDRVRSRPSIISPAMTGPIAKPIGLVAPNSAVMVPMRPRGVTSRSAASITPVLPS